MSFLPKPIEEQSYNVKNNWLSIFLQSTAIYKYQQAPLLIISYTVRWMQRTEMKNKKWFITIQNKIMTHNTKK